MQVFGRGAKKKKRLTEEKEKGNAVQDENVRDVSHASITQQGHLLLGSAHEEEAGSVEEEGRQILPAVVVVDIVLIDGVAVSQDKGNLDDAGKAGSHEGVAKDGVDHGAEREGLGMGGHGPSGHENDEARDEVALGTAALVSAQPDADEAGAPPDDAHGGVLQVVVDPGAAPAMLGKGVDAAPGGNDQAVEELLAAVGASEPDLADEQQDGQDDAVGDEAAAHDEMGQALAGVVAAAEAQRDDAAEQHLHPGGDRQGLAQHAVGRDQQLPDVAEESALDVQPEVDAQADLDDQGQHQPVGERGVHVVGELATLVGVAEEVADDGKGSGDNLAGDVETGADNAQDHAGGKEDAPGEHLDEDVGP